MTVNLTPDEQKQLAYMEGYLGEKRQYPKDSKLEEAYLFGQQAKAYHDWVEERYLSGFWQPKLV